VHYKVFLDTNIYDASNYSFRNGLFTQLKKYAKDGLLELQINSVVKGEVQKHIREIINKAVKDLNKVLSSRELSSFQHLSNYAERMITLSPAYWVQTTLDEFAELLIACKVEDISSEGINVERIVSDYFCMRYPFEQAKKDEFPDAITVWTVNKEIDRLSEHNVFPNFVIDKEAGISDDLIYCIVSNDKGFSEAMKTAVGNRPNEDVKLFGALNEFLSFLTVQNEKAAELQEKINNGYIYELIETAIEDGVSSAAYNVEEPNGYVDDSSCIETCGYKYEVYVVGCQTMSDGTTVARLYLEVQYEATIEYEFLNETESYWDKEDQTYLWKVVTDRVSVFRVNTELEFTIIINENNEVQFGDYIDVPSDIDVYDDDLIEVISSEDRDSR